MTHEKINLDTLCKGGHRWEFVRLFWTIYRCQDCGLTGNIGRGRFEAHFDSRKVNEDITHVPS